MGATGSALADDTPVSVSQEHFDNWVQLQEAIATQKTDWAVEREYLRDEIALLSEEIEALTEQKASLREDTTKIQSELAKLSAEEEQLKSASELVTEQLPSLEAGLRRLIKSLPPSLKDTLDSLIKRLPEPDKESSSGVAERMQVIAGLLSQMDKFNGQLTVAQEIRKSLAGENIQVRVLYLGLSQAWFVSPDNTFAGHGKPSPDGWVWTEDPSLAPVIQKAIAINENSAVASYVNLPASYQ